MCVCVCIVKILFTRATGKNIHIHWAGEHKAIKQGNNRNTTTRKDREKENPLRWKLMCVTGRKLGQPVYDRISSCCIDLGTSVRIGHGYSVVFGEPTRICLLGFIYE